MADFNAGSIGGSLDIDLRPFRQGLAQAKQQAAEFEKKKITPKVTLDTSDFDAGKLRVEAAVADLGNDSANVTVSIDITGAMAKLALLKAAMDDVTNHPMSAATSGIYNTPIRSVSRGGSVITRTAETLLSPRDSGGRFIGGGGGGFFGGNHRGGFMNPFNNQSGIGRILDAGGVTSHVMRGVGALAPAVVPAMIGTAAMGITSLGPALVTAAQAAGVFGAAAAAGAITLGVGLKGYASLIKADLKGLSASSTGAAGAAYRGVQGLKGAASRLRADTAPGVYGVIGAGASLGASVLPKLVPVVNAISGGLRTVITDIRHLTNSPLMGKFVGSLTTFFHNTLTGAAPVLRQVAGDFMHLFIDLRPAMSAVGQGLTALIDKGTKWIHTLSPADTAKFVNGITSTVGPVLHTLGAVLHALGSISVSLAPIRKPFLDFLSQTAKAVAGLDFHDLAAGLGSVLHAIAPLLPVARDLLNAVIKPLSVFMKDLSKDAITPLVHSLGKELAPAFHEIQVGLTQIAPYLAQFIGSLANLVNPTGVHLLTILIHDLFGALVALAPPILKIGTLLESVIDSGIMMALPAVNLFAKSVAGLATALAAVLNPIVALVEHTPGLTKGLGLILDAWVALKLGSMGIAAANTVAAASVERLAAAYAFLTGSARTAAVAEGEAAAAGTVGGAGGVAGGVVKGGIISRLLGGLGRSLFSGEGIIGKLGPIGLTAGLVLAGDKGAGVGKGGQGLGQLQSHLQEIKGINNNTFLGNHLLGGTIPGLFTHPLDTLHNAIHGVGIGQSDESKLTGQIQTQQAAFGVLTRAAERNHITLKALIGTTDNYTGALAKLGGANGAETHAENLHATALEKAHAAVVNAFNANTDYRQLLKDVTNQTITNTHGLKGNSAAVLENRTLLDQMGGRMRALVQSGTLTARQQAALRDAFVRTAVQMGTNKQYAENLATAMTNIPKNIHTQVVMNGTSGVLSGIKALRRALSVPIVQHVQVVHDKNAPGGKYYVNPPTPGSLNSLLGGTKKNGRRRHAIGGVTNGPMNYGDLVGDNVGGREAIIPLEKYDIPKRGELRAMLDAALNKGSDPSDSFMREVRDLLRALVDKTSSPEDLATAFGRLSDVQLRRLIQIARAE